MSKPQVVLSRFILLLFLITPVFADQLIVEPDNGREPVLNLIKEAKQSVKLVMYGLTDDLLLNAVIQKKLNGQTVRVILEQHPYKAENENNKAISKLNANHIPWQGSMPPLRLIHQKTLLIDGRYALVMTFNFTKSTFKNERNFGLLIDNPKQVKAIESLFSADWNHILAPPLSSDLIISPYDSREAFLFHINHAKRSIRIYAQTISDFKIIGALAKSAQRGVRVEILTPRKIRKKQADYLTRSGVILHQSKHYYIHAKALIIDDQKAIIGSTNLTRASLDDNRELSVISYDKTVIRQLNTTFNSDWQKGKGDMPRG